MARIKAWIKLLSSKIWRLEHAVAHAKENIKLQSVFCLFRQTRQTESKKANDMHYLLKMISPRKKIK